MVTLADALLNFNRRGYHDGDEEEANFRFTDEEPPLGQDYNETYRDKVRKAFEKVDDSNDEGTKRRVSSLGWYIDWVPKLITHLPKLNNHTAGLMDHPENVSLPVHVAFQP